MDSINPIAITARPEIGESGQPTELAGELARFLRALQAKNRSPLTLRAYRADVLQFLAWLEANTYAPTADRVVRADITEYLAGLGHRKVCGVSRARKLAAIREFFRFLELEGRIAKSPAIGVETPKREKNQRAWLLPDEYRAMLAAAGASPRDFAILTVFLQTGVRVSELCGLRLSDVDLENPVINVRGKGQVERPIELEKKGIAAIKSWLAVRPNVLNEHLFLNCDGEPIGERGVRKIVCKYRMRAGITKRASCHSFRHTFGTLKAQQGVSPYRLQQWLGHARLDTTQIYVHLGRENAAKEMEASSL